MRDEIARRGGAALAVVLLTLPAAASPDGDAAKTFGLIGEWAVACARPAREANPHERFALARDGSVHHTLDLGWPGAANVLRGLRPIGAGMLAARWTDGGDGEVLTVILQLAKGRLRTWESIGAKGGELIHKGAVQPEGRAVPWFERCAGRVS